MDFRTLRYFSEVARQKSFTLAAQKLFVTQPTLSRQIAELEEELGQQLFVRTTRKLELTEKGTHLYRQAQTILALVEKAKLDAMAKSALSGDLTISAAETPAVGALLRVAARFQEAHPNVRIHIRTAISERATEDLRLGLADFAVFMTPANLSDFDSFELPDETHWGVLVEKDRFPGRKALRPDDLTALRLFVPRLNLQERSIAGWLGRPVETLKIAGTYTLLYNAAFLAEAGSGVLGMDGIVEPPDNLAFLPLSPRLPARAALVWPKGRVRTNLTESFLAAMREAFSQEKTNPNNGGEKDEQPTAEHH